MLAVPWLFPVSYLRAPPVAVSTHSLLVARRVVPLSLKEETSPIEALAASMVQAEAVTEELEEAAKELDEFEAATAEEGGRGEAEAGEREDGRLVARPQREQHAHPFINRPRQAKVRAIATRGLPRGHVAARAHRRLPVDIEVGDVARACQRGLIDQDRNSM